MRRVPVLVLIAALIIATTVTILIRVLPASQFAAPPLVSPSATFTVTQGSYVVYFYSANAISVSSNVTVDFAFHTVLPAPIITLSAPLPPGITLSISYTDPITGYTQGISIYNDTAIGTLVITFGSSTWDCTLGILNYDYGAGAYTWKIPTTVIYRNGLYIAIPRWPPSDWVYSADANGVSFYDKNGNYIGTCYWNKKLTGTTGYSQYFDTVTKTYIFPDGRSIVIAVRPYIMAGVGASQDALITISAS